MCTPRKMATGGSWGVVGSPESRCSSVVATGETSVPFLRQRLLECVLQMGGPLQLIKPDELAETAKLKNRSQREKEKLPEKNER